MLREPKKFVHRHTRWSAGNLDHPSPIGCRTPEPPKVPNLFRCSKHRIGFFFIFCHSATPQSISDITFTPHAAAASPNLAAHPLSRRIPLALKPRPELSSPPPERSPRPPARPPLPPPALASSSSRRLVVVRHVTGSGGSAHLVMKGRQQSVARRMH